MIKIISVILLAALLMTVTSCGSTGDATEQSQSYQSISTSGATESQAQESSPETETAADNAVVKDTYEIETPYCVLKYPVKWQDKVTCEVSEAGDAYYIAFYATLDSNKVPLYTLVIGSTYDGYYLGTLETDLGTKIICVRDHSAEHGIALSDLAEREYTEMCYDINVIIDNLVKDYGLEV